ncbi:helix-turn-helix domain-containing protein [Naasia lichenicola]|uniref:helix-turn-helix domain-containing protein n=1 Tax=Naasia lichenicola TaxID=2565933 RepID=UPI001E301632|nr:helix-turn-helix domain-containing protein [Naasia lichenicola]
MAETAGRPRRSSQATLLDAAAELFLEQGYERTSIDQIAQRAGVARATFFNYFSAKGDLLWAELDPLLAEFGGSEGAFADREAAASALLGLAGRVASAPVVMIERELMGTVTDLAVAGLPRMIALTGAVRDRLHQGGASLPDASALAAALVAASVAGGVAWLDAGDGRGPLAEHVERAVRAR